MEKNPKKLTKTKGVPKKFKDIYAEFQKEQEQEEKEQEELIPRDKREKKRQEDSIQEVLRMVFGKQANW